MNYLVFDIETRNFFEDVGKRDPALLDLAVLGAYDSRTDKYKSYLVEDLPSFWPTMEEADVIIGYNSDHFDIPLLNKYYPGDLTRMKSIDLMKTIQNSLGRRIGLGPVSEATLGVGKSAEGHMAMEWWKQGKIKEIIDYCLQDVKITKELYEYMRDRGHVKYRDALGELIVLEVDTSDWGKKTDGGVTFTLGF